MSMGDRAALGAPLTLRCGLVLPNRLAKAAMTEALADDWGRSTPALERLYELWSKGGAGLLLTGNVQVDRRYVERPGNVCVDGPQDAVGAAALAGLAKAAKSGGSVAFAQISHAGRQSNGMVNLHPVGPGDAPMTEMPSGFFGDPRPLAAAEVAGVVDKFAAAAGACATAGFDGAQIHAAHGYLLSSFLNPRANNRPALFPGGGDPYGGSLENRARLLVDVVRATRRACGPKFAIAVKLNSADFQRGGFTTAEAAAVAVMLAEEGVDLLELSGGNYEAGIYFETDAPKTAAPSTREREAYFLDYAAEVQRAIDGRDLPLMVTGGWRTAAAMASAIQSGNCDVVGLGRPLCGLPDGPRMLLDGAIAELPRYEATVGGCLASPRLKRAPVKILALLPLLAPQSWFYASIVSLAETGERAPVAPLGNLLRNQYHEYRKAKGLRGVACRGYVHDGLAPRRGPGGNGAGPGRAAVALGLAAAALCYYAGTRGASK